MGSRWGRGGGWWCAKKIRAKCDTKAADGDGIDRRRQVLIGAAALVFVAAAALLLPRRRWHILNAGCVTSQTPLTADHPHRRRCRFFLRPTCNKAIQKRSRRNAWKQIFRQFSWLIESELLRPLSMLCSEFRRIAPGYTEFRVYFWLVLLSFIPLSVFYRVLVVGYWILNCISSSSAYP